MVKARRKFYTIRRNNKLNITDYGFNPTMIPDNAPGVPARVTAAYRERYDVICDYGAGSARLKGSEYYNGDEPYPTAGDFVMLDWQPAGESRINKPCPAKLIFRASTPPHRVTASRPWPPTSTTFSSCSRSTAISIPGGLRDT
jgi:hypothetical protein